VTLTETPIRRRVWEIVEAAKPGDIASRVFDACILSLIFLNVVALIVATVGHVQREYGGFLYTFEAISVAVFTVEYLARLWACTVTPAYRRPILGRIRFALRPMPLVDLIAILPFFLPFLGFDLRFVRMFRLFRLVRIAKIGRYYSSLRLMGSVIASKKEELILTTAMLMLLLVVSSCLMYECEHYAQPEAFPDIPSTMWWSVVTLTTVGYGDVYPETAAGKFFAAIIAILGIGMFALPTGIVGAGFVEEISQRKEAEQEDGKCPHCGGEL